MKKPKHFFSFSFSLDIKPADLHYRFVKDESEMISWKRKTNLEHNAASGLATDGDVEEDLRIRHFVGILLPSGSAKRYLIMK